MPGAPLPIGVIGAGKHGQRYLQHGRADVPELRLAAFSRRDAAAGAAQARELGCRFHADWRALIADPEVAAIVAVVPPTLHVAIADAVAAARKPLLIEKPLAPTAADAAHVVRVLHDVPTLMAHTLRWNAVVRTVRERLPGLGRLHALMVNQRFETSRLGWLDDPAVSGGGIVLHTGVHSFDLVRFLTGCEVSRVTCRTMQANTQRTEDNFMALFELAGDSALVAVNGCRSTLGRSGLIDIAADEGQLVADHQLNVAWTTRGLERTPLDLPPPLLTVREVLRDFVALVERGTLPPATVLDGARAVAIAEACMRSAATGTPADVPVV